MKQVNNNSEYFRQYYHLKNKDKLNCLLKEVKAINDFSSLRSFIIKNMLGQKGFVKPAMVTQLKKTEANNLFNELSKYYNNELTITKKMNIIVHYGKPFLPICSICNFDTLKYLGPSNGNNDIFSKTCSHKCGCMLEEKKDAMKKTNIEKYGTENAMQSTIIKNKQKKNNLLKYGVENVFQTQKVKDKSKSTCIERYNTEYACQAFDSAKRKELIDKTKETLLRTTGYDWNFKNPVTIKKRKQTWLNKYGVENIIQVPEIYAKAVANSFKIKTYKNTKLHYQGTYELYFLELAEKNNLLFELDNGPRIPYYFNDKNTCYYSDFILFNYNKIIEIKSQYTYNKRGIDSILEIKNEEKWKAAREAGYEIIILTEKNEIEQFFELWKYIEDS